MGMQIGLTMNKIVSQSKHRITEFRTLKLPDIPVAAHLQGSLDLNYPQRDCGRAHGGSVFQGRLFKSTGNRQYNSRLDALLFGNLHDPLAQVLMWVKADKYDFGNFA